MNPSYAVAAVASAGMLLQTAVPTSDPIGQLGKLGIDGLLSVAVIMLWRKLEAKDKKLEEKDKTLTDSQVAMTAALVASTTTIHESKESINSLKETIAGLKETIDQANMLREVLARSPQPRV